jgi:nucleotide-binding universal stress UspA family protein
MRTTGCICCWRTDAVPIKDILAVAIRLEDDEPTLRAAALLARRFEAHATALILAVHAASTYAQEVAPLSRVLEDLAAGARGIAARDRSKIEAWLDEGSHNFAIRDLLIEHALLRREVLAHARRADFSIVTRTAAPEAAHRDLLDTMLFGSGRPVLLMPPEWRSEQLFDCVVIGWDESSEASRAVHDALPLLRLAHDVVIASVDAKPHGQGDGSGEGLAVHLGRHDINARVKIMDSMGRSEGRALLDCAITVGADMLVLGAYGHSRAEEWLLGGVTRELTQASPIPLFLAH